MHDVWIEKRKARSCSFVFGRFALGTSPSFSAPFSLSLLKTMGYSLKTDPERERERNWCSPKVRVSPESHLSTERHLIRTAQGVPLTYVQAAKQVGCWTTDFSLDGQRTSSLCEPQCYHATFNVDKCNLLFFSSLFFSHSFFWVSSISCET